MKAYGALSRHAWALPFEAVMAVAAIVTAAQGSAKYAAISLFTLTVSFAPLVLERRARVRIPAALQTAYVAFVFASMFGGEVLGLYGRIWPWDDIVHFSSGLLIALSGAVWLTALTHKPRVARMPAWLQALFAFCLVAALIMAWEFTEFTSDHWFGTNSQGPLLDTMRDLLLGAAGGLIMSIAFLLHLRGHNVPVLGWIISAYRRLNR